MALYRALGETLVSQDEFRALTRSERAALESRHEIHTLHGNVNLAAIKKGVVPFDPIGMGLPLTVQIRHVYTGTNPRRRKKNMLLTSAMKSLAQFNAAPRAINFLTDRIDQKTDLSTPAATDKGTPLVYYSPALTKGASVLTVEFGFDRFDSDLLDSIGGLLQSAGSIPAFASASPYLIGAGLVVKLASGIASRFLETGPVFKVTEPIDFITPGSTLPEAGFRVMTQEDFPREVLDAFSPNNEGVLVDASGTAYQGDAPYVTISLNGAKVDDYENFEQTHASAAILEGFFNIRDEQEAPLGPILEGLKLYNDLKFRLEAEEVKKSLDALDDADSDEAKKLKARYDALIKNILQDELKPVS